jgi:hypothetical protein
MTAADLRDALAAEWALARAQLRLWTTPTGRLVRAVGAGASTGEPTLSAAELEAAVGRAARALDRALRRGPLRPGCLVRSLALAELLARRGVPDGLIRLGVRRAGGRVLDAHAWVELGGRVIGDDPRRVRRFTPLGAVVPVRRR